MHMTENLLRFSESSESFNQYTPWTKKKTKWYL